MQFLARTSSSAGITEQPHDNWHKVGSTARKRTGISLGAEGENRAAFYASTAFYHKAIA